MTFSCLFFVLILLSIPYNAYPQESLGQPILFSAEVEVLSPEHGKVFSNPVIPISVKLNTIAELTTRRYNDRIVFSLKPEDGNEVGNDDGLDSELLEHLLPSVNMRLCFHVKGEKSFSCSKHYVNSLETTAGSLYRLGEGEQTVFAWMMTVKTEEMREQVRVRGAKDGWITGRLERRTAGANRQHIPYKFSHMIASVCLYLFLLL